MMRSLLPILFVGVAVAVFFMYTNPAYSGENGILALQSQQASYNDALSNAKALQSVRDSLAEKYNALPPDNLERLEKLLPDNVNNIRLLIDIKGIADKHNMQIQNVKFQSAQSSSLPNAVPTSSNTLKSDNKEYGTFDLEFSTNGSYSNFVNFISDMEKSLRIVDVNAVDFSSADDKSSTYRYDLTITTYWLKS
jgi:Tfp pilus assembly protein PilO